MESNNIQTLTTAPNRLGRKYIYVMVVMVIITVAGVGFGIFGMVTGTNKTNDARELEVRLEQKDEALKRLEERSGMTVEVEDKDEISETVVDVVAAKDYIYIGEWGIKIKVPENLHSVSYVFYGGKNLLYVSGVVCGNGRCQYYPAFMENTVGSGTGLGALSRHHKSEAGGEIVVGEYVAGKGDDARGFGRAVYVDDEYFYTYEMANGFMGVASETQWESESVGAVGEMLKNGVSKF